MFVIALWVGVLIFGLGAIFSLLSAIRTLQISRRWSDYRLRRRYIVQARGSMVLSVFSGILAIALVVFGRLLGPSEAPAVPPPSAVPTVTETATPVPAVPPTETPIPASETPTAVPFTPTAVIPPTLPSTPTPVMPIAVQALVQGTTTPAFEVQFGRLRFSTEINNYTLVAPGEKFRNPIKQMYAVFTYQPVGVKVEWTALWYQNGELKYVDTTSWQDFPPGVAVASWLRPASEWQPGDYELQIFISTEWRASGRFVLEGEPPTVTPTAPATETFTPAPTHTASTTPTITRTPTASPPPPPSRTPRPTATSTVTPTPTRTAAPSATMTTRVVLPLAAATSTAAATPRPTETSTSTARPAPSPTSTATLTRTPSFTPTVTASATITPTVAPVDVTIYFTNTRPSGTRNPPFNEAVSREVPGSTNLIGAALDAYFTGPTLEEQSRGLVVLRNGFAGYRRVEFTDGVLSVYLEGNCQPLGNGYSLAQPMIATLRQFPGVLYVKIYDAYDHTGDALNRADSWPLCLDVIFTSTSTSLPTATKTLTPSPSATFTNTPRPTSTPLPTRTPVPTTTPTAEPSSTPTPRPTRTPLPTATATRPSATPLPTRTLTSTARPTLTLTPAATRTPTTPPTATHTRTATITFTPGPTNTPRPTLTLTPINAPTRAVLSTAQSSPAPAGTARPTSTLDSACNRGEFLGDVTIVDNAMLRPGERFRKTWRIQNAGDCPWTAAYSLIFARGDRLGGPASVPLPALVIPGQTADVSVDLVAPLTPGQYEGFWQLETPDRIPFGLGPAAAGHLWVKIRVAGDPVPTSVLPTSSPTIAATQPTAWAEATVTAFVGTSTAQASLMAPSPTPRLLPTPMVVVDFADRACEAQWQANEGILACPGADGDTRGVILPVRAASLEGGTPVTEASLLTIPSSVQDGYVLGLYPQYLVQAGDHLQAVVGCEQGAELCSVLFRVSYLDAAGAAHDLWTLGEFHDGAAFDLDIDLSELAGQQVRFVLSVNDLGSALGDRALWVAPRIVRIAGTRPTPLAPSATARATATATIAPTATLQHPSATPFVPTPTPPAPIPQFIDSIINFFKQLFGGS